ncbi:MAG TPA: SPFH domain-containing protein [Fermentimonas caenicola]|jgi:regulator of protease activity HflC (stomatin/prohibitin superfamily)|uniref:SPFH domain-containing protein n=1 Tax=Lascolabacillus TaxID=1924067 RepID=UPI0006B2F2B2|nr:MULTISPECIES: SPFH domain-containing protein [Lascolabacillus]MBP6175230.1 SPFH domain-containing protein [Fermentimonas sp.]MDI9625916.1 SPFH domain-containing protein [Bacteroidota bacterium]TAH61491.1 MAG: SPFH domain-containing protein [Fermentimonas caenicola]MBP6196622.1 SPFH domain-containing protein [Fermentimonas sp.]MBP7104429.1 SPFH domain-containing protein [Fermentimonas sp.]
METKEFNFKGFKTSGFLMIFLEIVLLAAVVWLFLQGIWGIIASITLFLFWLVFLFGFTKLEPNEAVVMIFFGKYKGVLKETGFFWVNPFITKKRLSLRARNLNPNPIKVNDKVGNPVLIGLVLVWKLKDTYKAMFEIDSQTIAASTPNTVGTGTFSVSKQMNAFENFVDVQSDAALRLIAGKYAYDSSLVSDDEITLRSGGDIVNDDLQEELNKRLEMAGIEIVEARINYLAYAPEIAAVMLRRQQAEAIIAAREKIVEGAVTMVKMALDKIEDEDIVELDADKKAAMVSNLLVVLCADESAQPVLNTGSLYQ